MATTSLPNDVDTLKALVNKRDESLRLKDFELRRYEEEVTRLQQELRLAQKKRFGASSEKAASDGQELLFNEVEEAAAKDKPANNSDEQSTDEVEPHTRKKASRRPIAEDLPRVDEVVEVSGDDRYCPHDGHELHEIGEEISERVDAEPAKIQVIRTRRKKYGCRQCEGAVNTAENPPQPLPKSIATAGLLAFIAISKFIDALPLYRLESIFQRGGLGINRGTMARWMIRAADLLTPITNLLREDLLDGPVIHCDETRVQVLKEPHKTATSLSYMWVQARRGPGSAIILYEYDPSRSGEVPVRLFEGYQGYIQVDGYEGYNKVCQHPGVTRVACLAHARRKFDEAIKASKKGSGKAQEALGFIKKLYKVEKSCKGKSADAIFQIRQEKARPILDEFREWLTTNLTKVPPKTLTGKALNYLDDQWDAISRYVESGHLHIDNNYLENKIRPFAVGRKNWLCVLRRRFHEDMKMAA